MELLPHWIAGKPDDRSPSTVGDVYNPATGAVTKQVAFATPDDVDAAVAAAAEAWQTWRHTSLAKRTRVLFALRSLIDKHRPSLAAAITSEHGKVLDDAGGEVQRGLEVVEYACGVADLLKGERSENVSTAVDSWTLRQPLGVVAGISPFNFPVMVPMWMAPIAIACGNCFILKPSEKDPTPANLIAELWEEAGLPPGVFSVVHGDGVAAEALLRHPGIAAVSSVGSTPIARSIYETATAQGKRVQALGGAKNHAVVLPDADMERTADALTGAAYGSAGERCMAISVVVAVGDAGDAIVEAVAERAHALRVGPGDEPGVEMGPLVTGVHRDKVAAYVDAGVGEGAELVVDGRGLRIDANPDGFFLGPCLFDRVDTTMSIYTDEIFGPVLAVVRADSLDDALGIVNANRYANGTAIFTSSGGAARRYQSEVEVGMVGVNIPIPVPMAYYSFGGWKDSLFGDLHVHGADGVRFYTRGKVVTSRWPDDGSATGVDTVMPTSS